MSRTAPRTSTKQPYVEASDFKRALVLLALWAPAWLLPERAWPRLARSIAHSSRRLRPARASDLATTWQVRVAMRRGHAETPEAAQLQGDAGRVEEVLYVLRAHRPVGWRPRIELRGEEHLAGALARGQGAVLWVAPGPSSSLVTKQALAATGFAVSHLSREEHISKTALGQRLLNPIWTAPEDRHLTERVVIPDEGVLGALRQLRERLREGRVVSITMGDSGARVIEMPVFDERIRVASGAPHLAVATGAALLPVCTERHDDGSFIVHILPALYASDLAAGRPREEAVEALARAAGQAIEPFPAYPFEAA